MNLGKFRQTISSFGCVCSRKIFHFKLIGNHSLRWRVERRKNRKKTRKVLAELDSSGWKRINAQSCIRISERNLIKN